MMIKCTAAKGECYLQEYETDKCTWSNSDGANSDDCYTQWSTSCGHEFLLNDGTPEYNDMGYCCFCGKPIEQLVEQ